MGRTITSLPDGRYVSIGGEHEDSYDQDFSIYNDVVVFNEADDSIDIYGYPKAVFPPTDFHSATLTGDCIVIIGCLGYPDDRRPGNTPVYALELPGCRISETKTSGDSPGWIYKHEARLEPNGSTVTIRGGKVVAKKGRGQLFWSNLEDYAFDIRSGVWCRLTNRNWSQFSIRPKNQFDPAWTLAWWPEEVLPQGVEYTLIEREPYQKDIRIEVAGVPVSVAGDFGAIKIVIEGEMPGNSAIGLAKKMRANAQRVAGCPCVLERA